jgi:hypothetical protein
MPLTCGYAFRSAILAAAVFPGAGAVDVVVDMLAQGVQGVS